VDGLDIDDLDTPCLTVDLDAFEDNVQRCMHRWTLSACVRT